MDWPKHPASNWKRVSDRLCAWGTSPFWHPQEDRLYWLDRGLHRLWRLHTPSEHLDHWDLPQEPASVVPCRSGGLLIAMGDGIYHSATWHDTPQKIADAPFDPQRLRFGDGKCDPWGRYWIGTAVREGAARMGQLWCLNKRIQRHPAFERVGSGVVRSDGLAWSPNGQELYWTDEACEGVDHLVLRNPGQFPPELSPPQSFAHAAWRALHPLGGRPGGITVDRSGRLWAVMRQAATVVCLSPQGELLGEYATPTQCPTMLCWGGADLKTLYLTSARADRSSEELARYPDSGAVFALSVDAPGLPIWFYED